MFSNNKSSKNKIPNYNRRRLGAGLALAAVVFGSAKGVESVGSGIQEARQINKEVKTFSELHLSDNLKGTNIDPSTVTSYTITSNDKTPTQVANFLGAIDTRTVAGEISDQVGGDKSMEPGETIVLPNRQLIPPTQVAEK